MIKLSSRLQAIQDEITRTNNIIIDVGCDHCKTAIYALQTKKASFVYNIENKKLPLLNGIKHLSEHQLLQFTKNILGEGLTSTEIKGTIDYCVISGMGGKNITQIIKHQLPQIKIKTYIVVANDHPEVIRAFLKKMN
jgi:tRNA A22 N-methylase